MTSPGLPTLNADRGSAFLYLAAYKASLHTLNCLSTFSHPSATPPPHIHCSQKLIHPFSEPRYPHSPPHRPFGQHCPRGPYIRYYRLEPQGARLWKHVVLAPS